MHAVDGLPRIYAVQFTAWSKTSIGEKAIITLSSLLGHASGVPPLA